jgi:hypothetical protein
MDMDQFLLLAGRGLLQEEEEEEELQEEEQPRVLDFDPRWTADRRSSLQAAVHVGPWCCRSSSLLLLLPGLMPGWLACCPPACTHARARRTAQPCSHLPCSHLPCSHLPGPAPPLCRLPGRLTPAGRPATRLAARRGSSTRCWPTTQGRGTR